LENYKNFREDLRSLFWIDKKYYKKQREVSKSRSHVGLAEVAFSLEKYLVPIKRFLESFFLVHDFWKTCFAGGGYLKVVPLADDIVLILKFKRYIGIFL
jgi:hypothetical protein